MLDALTMEEVGFSLCEQRCIVRGNVMRALGLPVVGDYVDGWANYSRHGHFWISLVENTGETYTLYPRDSIPKTDNPIDAAFFKPSMLPDSSYPYWVDSLKRVAKVYRKAFYSVNETDQHTEDVSKKYGLTDSVVIYTDGVEKAICLCTFKSEDGWRVAIKGEVNNGRCVFRNLGASIIYLPAKLEKGKIIALDAPFALNRGGKVRRMIPASGKQTVRLNRKYIFLTTWTNRWNEMTGGCFEGSNDSHFRRADVLWRISELPVYRNEVKLQTSKSYRYVRYISPGISKSALAELFFFDKEKELKGEAIGEGLTPSSQKRVFDRDWKTIGDPRTENYWVGLDLRERCHLDKIVYYPHNDDNFITPGDLYELFYYNEGNWHSLGTKVAESEELIYEQVPVNVLFVLKNTTRGQEERIFTYENGKQVWW